MMQNKRQHERFRSDLIEINGRMILAHKVEIIDISLGGVALKTDKRLYAGKECLIKLEGKSKSIGVKGTNVRCELTNIEERSNGEGVLIYRAGMMFEGTASNMISDFIDSVEWGNKGAVQVMT
jgi:PilZ domain-containing protein